MDSEMPETAPTTSPEPDAAETPKRRGRKPGVPNKLTRDAKELIIRRGKPLELLCDVARGVKIRVGPQAGPGEPTYVYPTLEQRLQAARILSAKVAPDMKAQEITGRDGEPLLPPPSELDDAEIARRLAFVLRRGGADG